jgi:predicted CXXCH cytochrome family protein
MRSLVFGLCCGLAAGCAAPSAPSATGAGSRVAAQVRQREVMRRATRTAARNLDVETCLMQGTVARSLVTADQCLSCHDGAQAPSIGSHTHPTHVTYADSSGRTTLRPVVGDGIVLVNGMVECTSCHDPASTLAASTALTLDRSTLCLGCHVR